MALVIPHFWYYSLCLETMGFENNKSQKGFANSVYEEDQKMITEKLLKGDRMNTVNFRKSP
jgi:hypothetical protein